MRRNALSRTRRGDNRQGPIGQLEVAIRKAGFRAPLFQRSLFPLTKFRSSNVAVLHTCSITKGAFCGRDCMSAILPCCRHCKGSSQVPGCRLAGEDEYLHRKFLRLTVERFNGFHYCLLAILGGLKRNSEDRIHGPLCIYRSVDNETAI
jgi:hypothetical protein